MLRFYGSQSDIMVYVAASININGLIPENYNILAIHLRESKKSAGKKCSNFKIKLYGPLNECLLEKEEARVYI